MMHRISEKERVMYSDLKQLHQDHRIASVTNGRYMEINVKVQLPDGFQPIDEELLSADLRKDIEDLLTESGFELDEIEGKITIGSDGQ